MQLMARDHSQQDEQSKETLGTQAEENSLLFINHYSRGPTSGRHGPSRTAVSVHVQRTIRKKKRHDSMMRLNSREFSKGLLKYRIAKTDEKRDVISPYQSSTCINHYPDQISLRTDATNLQSALERRPEAQLALHQQASSSNNIWTSRFARFENPASFSESRMALPHLHSRFVRIALTFFLQTFIPRVFPVPSQAREHGQWVIQRAATSPALYFAITAAGAASLLALTNSFPPYQDRVTSQCNAKSVENIAMKYLRISLNSGKPLDSSILIYVIMCLMVTEIVNGNMDAIQVHAGALSRLIRSQKNLIAIPIHVMETFISSCHVSSIITGQPPPPPPYYPTEMTKVGARLLLESIVTSHSHLTDLGQAFFDPQIEAALSPKLVELLRNMRAVMLWREHYHHTRQKASDTEMAYFHNLSWRTCFLALNLPYAAAAAEGSYETNFEDIPPLSTHQPFHRRQGLQEPCRLALLIFWNACNQVNRPGSLLYRTLAAQLKIAFREALGTSNFHGSWGLWELLDEDLHGMLLWILLLGAFITQDVALRGGGDDDELFFMRAIAEYLRVSSAGSKKSDWREIEGMVQRFLYLRRVFGNSMEKCWMEVIELKTELTMQ